MYRSVASVAQNNLKAAEMLAEEVLCLPIHAGLKETDQQDVIATIREVF